MKKGKLSTQSCEIIIILTENSGRGHNQEILHELFHTVIIMLTKESLEYSFPSENIVFHTLEKSVQVCVVHVCKGFRREEQMHHHQMHLLKSMEP